MDGREREERDRHQQRVCTLYTSNNTDTSALGNTTSSISENAFPFNGGGVAGPELTLAAEGFLGIRDVVCVCSPLGRGAGGTVALRGDLKKP